MTPTNLDDQEVWAASNHRRAGMSDTPQTYIPACGCIDCGNTIGELRAQLEKAQDEAYGNGYAADGWAKQYEKAEAQLERVRLLPMQLVESAKAADLSDEAVGAVGYAAARIEAAITGEQE